MSTPPTGTDVSSSPRQAEAAVAPPRTSPVLTWLPVALLVAAFVLLFRTTILNMTERWADPTFSHGWIVAPAAVILAWIRRDTWVDTPVRPATVGGLVIIALGLLSMVAATAIAVLFVPYISMLVVVGGMIVYFGGWAWLRKLIFPYAFLYFMVPWPDFLVEMISFPMQIATSAYSALLASMTGIGMVRDGVNLYIPSVGARFEVAVACSGMHSLVALMALGAVFAYFMAGPLWKRWLLFGLSLPMSMVANIIRVYLILCVAAWISPKLAAKAFHDWSAYPLFLFNTLGLLGIRNLLMRQPKPAAEGAGAALDATEDDDAF